MNELQQLIDGLHNGFVDETTKTMDKFTPRLVVNDYEQGVKVLSTIESELSECTEFYFSVAFITNSGVQSIINLLDLLEKRGIKGKIITSQYQNFTQPIALRRLLKYKNIELRIVTEGNFHAKGYIFKKKDNTYSFLIGSSNLTQNALSENKEWNVRLSSYADGSIMKSVLLEFKNTFEQAVTVTEPWIKQYEREYFYYSEIREDVNQRVKAGSIVRVNQIIPNKMQVEALAHIAKLREAGKNKALLISATGTGKTYLSAFDVKAFAPKKFLFVVHRENIAKAAMRSFENVLGYNLNAGLLTGNRKDFKCDYLFATIQTISKDQILYNFQPDHFDYILIDEVHKAGAATYRKVIDYFRPKFLLGMTATPERSDDFDIFKTFDYNIAYEIRLEKALEEKMLAPFHYFGIQDLTVDGEIVSDVTDFNKLVCKERVDKIVKTAEHYGHDGDRVKGLIFCSRKEEAKQLSNELNRRNYRTVALCGEDKEDVREAAIERLESDNAAESLDYILSVDIFNEGIDIPTVNQIIMLRSTQSAIIFVQQLGRGLRKAEGKEYLTVIDFIGNYNNNYLVPIALYGDRTYNKDNIRKLLNNGSSMIPGCSTVNFDEITKKRIYASIDSANFNSVRLIKECYYNLKNKLGRIPSLIDFDEYGTLDVLRIFDKMGSYHNFLSKYEKDYCITLDAGQAQMIEFVSRKFASGKRVHELELLKAIIDEKEKINEAFKNRMLEAHGIKLDENMITNLVNLMTNQFPTGSSKNTYSKCIFIEEDGDDYRISKSFMKALQKEVFSTMMLEIIAFGLYRNKLEYSNRYQNTSFCLYKKYTYEDVCRLLNWEKGEVAQNIGGYKFDEKTKTFPVFINYHKDENISDSIAYEDEFISPSKLLAYSKANRKVSSKDIATIYNAKQSGVTIELFVRRNKDDAISKEFYYLGRMNAIGEPEEMVMKKADKPVVKIIYALETPVREDIFNYIIM